MQVINHHQGNYTFADLTSSSVMYGTIKVTPKEFASIVTFLWKKYAQAEKSANTYVRDGLNHCLNYSLPQWEKRKKQNRYPQHNNRVCLGVTATELIFEQWNLPRYKKQNYVIVIK